LAANSPYTIGFSYTGDADFQSASGASLLTVIDKTLPTFSNLSDPTIVFGTPSTVISGHLNSNNGLLVPPGEIIEVTLNGVTHDAPLDGNDDFTTTWSTGALGVAGSPYAIGFHYAGDSKYKSATATSTLTVIPARPLINWAQPADITYGTALSSTELDATAVDPTLAPLGGSFVYTPAAGTVLGAGSGQTLQVTFTPTDNVDYSAVTGSTTINVGRATPTFTSLSAPTISEGTPSTVISGHLSANAGVQAVPAGEVIQVTLNGVTQSALLDGSDNFSTTFATNLLLLAGSPYTIGFAYAGDSNFNLASDSSLLTTRPFEYVTGADAGGGPHVELWDGATGKIKLSFYAYSPYFNGGARVALGDVRHTKVPDIVTGPGPGMSPLVRIFDGLTGQKIFEFMAFDDRFMGGIFVATADFNGDGYDDIIVGADAGGGPHVKIFDGKFIAFGGAKVLDSFYAYSPYFNGGVRVAAGDVNGDGMPDVITAPGPGGSADIRVFDGAHLNLANDHADIIREFMAYSPYFNGGAYVAAGDMNGDHKADIITGAGPGGSPHVKVVSGADLSLLDSFMAYSPYFNGGARVGYLLGQDGHGLLLTAMGTGGAPVVRTLDGLSLTSMASFDAYDVAFIGGVFIGGFGS
jgi:hypothetical protein